jgi:hypothetical protein
MADAKEEDTLWETSKENVMPIKRGRSAKGLQVSSIGAEGQLQQDDYKLREKVFENMILESKSPESSTECILDCYVKYFKWIRDTFPSDCTRALALLERCTCDLSHEEKYKNDIRFVKLWIEYADSVRTPGEIFSYMQSNKIGTQLSIFWIAWAFVAEKLENYKLTDQIFQKGLKKQAEPKDVLQKRYQQFQRRMARHYLNMAEEQEQSSSQPPPQPLRAALTALSKSEARGILRVPGSSRPRCLGQSSNISTGTGRAPTNNGTRTFEIFPEDAAGIIPEDSLGEGYSQWKQLGTAKSRRKENDGPVSKWRDAAPLPSRGTITSSSSSSQRQAGASSAGAGGPTNSISIFADEDENVNDRPKEESSSSSSSKPTSKNNAPSLSIRAQLCEATQIETIAKNPLLRHKALSVVPPIVMPGPVKVCEPVKTAPVVVESKIQTATTSVFEIFSDEHEELSAAAAPIYQKKQERNPQPTATIEDDAQLRLLMGEVGDDEDVTINTKLARQDIDSMFCSSPGEAISSKQSGRCSELDGDLERGGHRYGDMGSALNEISEIRETSGEYTICGSIISPPVVGSRNIHNDGKNSTLSFAIFDDLEN